MAARSSPPLQEAPHGETTDRFPARLPSLWQLGEARPTHKARVRPPRHWRTRKDPFEGVWCDVLLWLQKDPDTNAKELLARLRAAHSGRFSNAQPRTLQRRVKDWRGVMAKRLVYAASDEPAVEQRYRGELALVGTGINGSISVTAPSEATGPADLIVVDYVAELRRIFGRVRWPPYWD